jgi:putative hemolysin
MFHGMGLSEKASAHGATTIVVVGITYFSIVVGELVPKRIAQFNAEGIARLMARPISMLAILSRPFVYLLSVSTDGILRLLGKRELSSANLTEEDIHAMLAEGSQSGLIEKQEHEMVRNVFRLDERQIASLMSPRGEIVYLDIEQPLESNLEHLIGSDHSRFPVCRGGMHEVLGVITAKRLLKQHLKGEFANITDYLQPAVYVPESLTGMKLLEQFRESGVQMVFVVDEYGEILGLITLQDVLEALAGEFKPRDPEDVWAVQREDGSWLLDGLIPIPELKDRLDLKSVPEEDKGRYHTLSGMMMWLIGSLPRTSDVAEWQGWRLEVIDLDGNRIDKVLASRLPDVQNEAADPESAPTPDKTP